MKRRKLAAVCLAIAMLTGCLTACGGTSNSAAQSTSSVPEEVTSTAPEPSSAPAAEPEGSQSEASSAAPEEATAQAGVPDPNAKTSELATYTQEGYDLPLFDDTLGLSYG